MKRLMLVLIITFAAIACTLAVDVQRPSVSETSVKTAGVSFTSGVIANYGFTYQDINSMLKPTEIDEISFFVDEDAKAIKTNVFYIYYQLFDISQSYSLSLKVSPLVCDDNNTISTLDWTSSTNDKNGIVIDSSNNSGAGYTVFDFVKGAETEPFWGVLGLTLSIKPPENVINVDWSHVYQGSMTLELSVI